MRNTADMGNRIMKLTKILIKIKKRTAWQLIRGSIFLLAALLWTGCAAGNEQQEENKTEENTAAGQESYSDTLFAMDTYMTFTAYGPGCTEAVEEAMKEVERLETILSTELEGSEIFRMNQTGSGTVSGEAGELLETALAVYESTGGLFDFTVYPLVQLWGFTTGEFHVPSETELKETLELVGAGKLEYKEGVLTLQPGQKIDFGGIAKGYAASCVMEIYKNYNITSGLISLGGNIQVLNRKIDGSLWRIGIQDPDADRGKSFAVLSVENCAVVTSGGYERYFEEGGEIYIHILDPRTGYPADSGLLSATAVCADGTLADALSTSLYIMGVEEAVRYWREQEGSFDMVLITKERELYVTEGLAEHLETAGETQVHVIKLNPGND